MSKILILSDSGSSIHSDMVKESENQLIGGWLGAVLDFAENTFKERSRSFRFQNKKFTFLKEKEFTFIAESPKDIKEKRIIRELSDLAERFFNKYSDGRIREFRETGDMSIFKDLEEIVRENKEERGKEIEGFWEGIENI